MAASPLTGFTSLAIADWAKGALSPGAEVISDGLASFGGVSEAGVSAILTVGRFMREK